MEQNSLVERTVVGFAGMTHLGIVSASVLASRGFRTICFDRNEKLIGQLREGNLPIVEPQLDGLIAEHVDRLCFTSDLKDLEDCNVVYISLDVPTDEIGRSDLLPVSSLIGLVSSCLSPEAVLVTLCQVPPGFTRKSAYLPLDRVFYQVETLIFGRAVERAQHPERYIIGCANPGTPINLNFMNILSVTSCPILPMRYESAEFAKIAINCCLVSSISVANTLSEICESTGADWSEIAPALKLDARIGAYAYLAPGLGLAGGNLERDLATVLELSETHGTNADLIRAWLANSTHRRNWAAEKLKSIISDVSGARIAIWGLAYKENTSSTKNSPSLATIDALQDADLVVHDPAVTIENLLFPRLSQPLHPLECLVAADALMILTPWPVYKSIGVELIARRMTGTLVIDPYRVLDPACARAAGLRYWTLGMRGGSVKETQS